MPKLTIDGKEIEIDNGLTVMQACESAGIEIPHFCFHKRLKIAGNCRMCLVDIEKSPKPVASCSMPASEGMIVHTNSARVLKAREGVMEFLLINHPLDCPICDQGGECDLQDQAFKYGRGKSRYSEEKRSVKDKNLGPLVETHMTRCIHCTRCIRFSTDIAGVPEIGTIGRGEHMEIVSYLEKTLTSELSGNVIDLCPVGALNSKPYAFTARSWELEGTESIDVMDAVGSNIRIDSRGLEVMRILPKLNEDVNEEWISDNARFSYDGLKNQRLDRPYLKQNGKFCEVSWEIAISNIVSQFNSMGDKSKIATISGFTTPCETMFLLKKLLSKLGSTMCDGNQLGYGFDLSARGNYLFNSTIAGIEKADICLIIGANPRQVAPVLNARIGKMVRSGLLKVARIGEEDNQTYKINELGNDIEILEYLNSYDLNIHKTSNKSVDDFANLLSKAVNPMIIVGDGVLSRSDSHGILSILYEIAQKYNVVRSDWNGFNILHNHASMVGTLDLGFIYGPSGSSGVVDILNKTQNGGVKILYLLGADDIDMNKIGEDVFVIYQGHHGDAGANRADLILPEAAYTEQEGMYVNMEGRVQLARAAVELPNLAKTGISIISLVAKALNIDIGKNELHLIRQEMAKENKIFAHIDKIITNDFVTFKSMVKLTKKPLEKISMNYYMTDPITRASITMAKCTKAIQELALSEIKNRTE
jgi:NADH-quinone oxidoreductase subunit G